MLLSALEMKSYSFNGNPTSERPPGADTRFLTLQTPDDTIDRAAATYGDFDMFHTPRLPGTPRPTFGLPGPAGLTLEPTVRVQPPSCDDPNRRLMGWREKTGNIAGQFNWFDSNQQRRTYNLGRNALGPRRGRQGLYLGSHATAERQIPSLVGPAWRSRSHHRNRCDGLVPSGFKLRCGTLESTNSKRFHSNALISRRRWRSHLTMNVPSGT